jgi:hypothetical protein
MAARGRCGTIGASGISTSAVVTIKLADPAPTPPATTTAVADQVAFPALSDALGWALILAGASVAMLTILVRRRTSATARGAG